MKADIDAQYPRGHLVALFDGKIVADAATMDELQKVLAPLAKSGESVFVARRRGLSRMCGYSPWLSEFIKARRFAAQSHPHPYKGNPPPAWIEVVLIALDGKQQKLQLLADTGNPFAMIVSAEQMATFKHWDWPSANTNFGPLRGGVLRISILGVCDDLSVTGYAGDAVVDAARSSDPELDGLAGLPLLRNFRYGGNNALFWIQR